MHLTGTEFIEHLDGALSPERTAHLSSCDRCRREADGLLAALGAARDVDAPEPSPLVWEHFSARVRDAIDSAPEPRFTIGWRAFRLPGLALAGATLLVLFINGFWQRAVEAPVPITVESGTTGDVAIDRPFEPDPEWIFVTEIADGIDWDAAGAAGLALRPGAAERAALQLSADEQAELARLLREATAGRGSL
jgi:hypothetical protein